MDGMAALFIAKRGIINIYRGSPRNYNNNTLQSSRCFTSQGSDGAGESSASMNEARQEAMGTSTDTKAPNVSVSYAADTAKEGLKRATELAKETSENHTETEDAAAMVAGGEDEKEENVTVGEIETLKGKNQSSS
ncbi:hypothetical protein HID58_051468 [Brassica napus]|uniref:Uncharacterized protein n=1 Tax=Brassica napus TaxID=3708 RepID=A0ABQ8A921_BRANA|nr:hypothetical protein HID58_051468 [Brassica napus]